MSSTQPKVAVITRTKNRSYLLGRAIQSVHSQSMKDFVHVIINDGGDAASVDKVLRQYRDIMQDRVKIIHNDKSIGMEAASNKAINSVDSKYIVVHDDDDSWHKDFLQKTTELLTEKNTAGVVVKTNKITEDVNEMSGVVTTIKIEPWMPDVKVINLYRQCIDNQMTPITFIYRRSVYDEIGHYDENLPVLGDWDFGIRFLQKYDVEFLDPGFALANYHHRRYKRGSTANNSFGEGAEKHRYYSNILMNKYLRKELEEGSLGVGYIMSKLRYDQREKAEIVKRLLPSFVTKRLKRRIQN